MLCPHCSIEVEEKAPECPGCGLIFSKYTPKARPVPGRPRAVPRAWLAAGGASGVLLVLLLGFWASTNGRNRPAAPTQPAPSVPPQPADEWRPAPAPAKTPGYWRIEGTVIDLVRLTRVARARIEFIDPDSSARRSTMTDGKGHYAVELAPHPTGYEIRVSHPGYEPGRWWRGDFDDLEEADRLRLGSSVVIRAGKDRFFRDDDPPGQHDLALFPRSLDKAEERAMRKANSPDPE